MKKNLCEKLIVYLSSALKILISVCFLFTQEIHAQNNSMVKKVSVAYFEKENFQKGKTDNEIKSGYSYEILQEISNYTGWKYEYIYGNQTELYNRFLNGEIDLFPGLAYTKNNNIEAEWPDYSIDTENYSLYMKYNDESFKDIRKLNEKRIGVVLHDSMTEEFIEWNYKNSFTPEYVYYDSYEILPEKLNEGEIDGYISSDFNIKLSENIQHYIRYAENKTYICARKGAKRILSGLNYALGKIENVNPNFYYDLRNKYYSRNTVNTTLSNEEREWMKQYPLLKIGYTDDYMPFCGTDSEGNVTGILKDIAEKIRQEFNLGNNLVIQYIPYDSQDEMITALSNGKIDTAFPVEENAWNSERTGIMTTKGIFNLSMSAVYKGDYSERIFDRIAVSSTRNIQKLYIMEHYPDSEIIYTDSGANCLTAVNQGIAGCSIITNVRLAGHLSKREFKNLVYIPLKGNMTYCFGLLKGNTSLLSIMNRGISLLDKTKIGEGMYNYVENYTSYKAIDFVKDHIGIIFLIVLGILIVIIIAVSIYIKIIKNTSELEKKASLELKKALDKEQLANISKSTFLNSMSHDIRTPMNAILGYTELMGKEINNEAKLKDYLEKVKTSGDYLLTLINNVLEMARIDSGKESLDESYVDLSKDENSVYPLLENEINKRHLHYSQGQNIQHRYVYADMAKIKEISMNILSNAIKYTPEGGSIKLQFNEIPSDREGYALYENVISDTGIGMSKEFQEQIFEPFLRERDTTESKIGGTGLGMAIVKKLVDMMGGQILVESELGKGSTFKIILYHRIAEKMENYIETQKKTATGKINAEGKRILLAEDNELNAEIAIVILSEIGFDIEVAEDGVQCVDMVSKADPGYYSLILMDIQMPKLNGYEAAKKIRRMENRQKAQIPIIAMTANAFDEDRKNALDAGMNDHLAKPIEIPKLQKILSDVFGEE